MEDHWSRPIPDASSPEAPIGPFGAVARSAEDPDVLIMAGEVDVAVAQDAAADLEEWRGVRRVDLSEVTFLDSAGMRLLVQVARLVRPHRLQVVGAAGQPLDTLHHFGAEQLVELVPPAGDAEAAGPPTGS